MKNERLDELIDRVAADLVASPANPAFARQMRELLHSRQQPLSARLILGGCVAAAIVMALALFEGNGTSTVTSVRTEVAALGARVAVATPGALVGLVAPVAPVAPARTQPRSAARAASGSPVVLPLEIAPLADPPFDVDSLEVGALAIAALENEDQKEPR